MKSILRVVLILLVLALGRAVPAGAPLKAEVGDWVSLKLSGRNSPTLTLKQTLIAKDDATATIRFEQTVGETVLPAKEHKIPTEQLRDPAKLATKFIKAKVEKLKSGRDTAKVKGNDVQCEWTQFKVTFDAGGKTVESTSKIWIAPEVPLNGLVKMENDVGGNETVMELTDYGRAK